MNLKDLLAETVSHCLYINLDRSTERRAEFEKWAKDLPFHRVQGVDGRTLADAAIASKADPSSLGVSDIQHRGAIGCAMSHLKAIETAISLITPGDQRPVLIMEDDGRIPEENLSILESVLKSAVTGDHCLLRAAHATTRGYFPIAAEHPHIVEPSGALTTTAYLVSPRMLPVLRDLYNFNLERSDMRQVDQVNETMHRNLALNLTPPRGAYDEDLMRVYKESREINNVDVPKFRAVNPAAIFVTDARSTIRPDDVATNFLGAVAYDAVQQTPDLSVATGHPLKVLSREEVIRLVNRVDAIMPGLAETEQAQVKTTLHKFAEGSSGAMSCDDLMKAIQPATGVFPRPLSPQP